MRALRLLFVILTLLLLAAPLIQAQGPGTGPGMGGGPPRGGERERVLAAEEARDWGNLSAPARERALGRAEAANLFGGLTWRDGVASSRFATFGYANGSLSAYQVRDNGTNVTYFTSVQVSGFNASAPTATGSVLRALGNESFFSAHANPLGLFSYRVRNAVLQMRFDLAEGVNASADGTRGFRVLGPGGAHGHVILTSNATYSIAADNRSATVTLGPHARLLFAHHPQQSVFSGTLHPLLDASATDGVGGMLSVVSDAAGPVQDRMFVAGVTMRATRASEGRIEVLVSSESEKGRAVVIHLDAASLGLAMINVTVFAGLDITMDGQPIRSNATVAEAIAATQAVAHVSAHGSGIQVIVGVPRFSDHTIGIAAAQASPPVTTTTTATTTTTTTTAAPPATTGSSAGTDADTPGPSVSLLLVAAAALALALRRR